MMALKYLKVGLNVKNSLKTKKSNLRYICYGVK